MIGLVIFPCLQVTVRQSEAACSGAWTVRTLRLSVRRTNHRFLFLNAIVPPLMQLAFTLCLLYCRAWVRGHSLSIGIAQFCPISPAYATGMQTRLLMM